MDLIWAQSITALSSLHIRFKENLANFSWVWLFPLCVWGSVLTDTTWCSCGPRGCAVSVITVIIVYWTLCGPLMWVSSMQAHPDSAPFSHTPATCSSQHISLNIFSYEEKTTWVWAPNNDVRWWNESDNLIKFNQWPKKCSNHDPTTYSHHPVNPNTPTSGAVACSPCSAEAAPFTSEEMLHLIWSHVGGLAGWLFAHVVGPFISQYTSCVVPLYIIPERGVRVLISLYITLSAAGLPGGRAEAYTTWRKCIQ